MLSFAGAWGGVPRDDLWGVQQGGGPTPCCPLSPVISGGHCRDWEVGLLSC